MYLPAMGNLSAGTDYNATKYPGIAKPSTPAALEMFKELQRQLNRLADTKGLPKIGVDGSIGPATMALFKQIGMIAQLDAMPPNSLVTAAEVATLSNSSVSVIASGVDDSMVSLRNYADALGVPATVPGKIVVAPTVLVASSGAETQVAGSAENALASLGQLGTIEKVAIVGLLGVIGYVSFGKKKGRRGRK